MGMTIAEKILSTHTDGQEAKAGNYVNCRLDIVMGHDVSAPRAVKVFEEMGAKEVFNRDKVVLIDDHYVPNGNINAAIHCLGLKRFAEEQQLSHYYPVGTAGICHAFLPEAGLIKPGQLVIGGDSHTCTYGALGAFSTGVGGTDLAAGMAIGMVWLKVPETIKVTFTGKLSEHVCAKDVILFLIGQLGVEGGRYQSLEIYGEAITNLSMEGRMTIANMAVELGAKCVFLPIDKKTEDFLAERGVFDYNVYEADADAHYSQVCTFDASEIVPVAACPFLPSNIKPVADLSDVKIDQVVIGSCTNGHLGDLRLAAAIVKGKRVPKSVKFIVIPATRKIYLKAIQEGIIETLLMAGATVTPPSCGACAGHQMGVLGPDEVAASTTNRNFVSRMGHKTSRVYLVSPAVAAASAITGYLTHPREVLRSKREDGDKE